MLFEEIRGLLTDEELAAIEYLESCGFSVMTEARLDDCKQKDGKRVRTFSLSGRYAVMLGLKSVEDRIETLQPEPEPEADETETEVEAESEVEIDEKVDAKLESESDDKDRQKPKEALQQEEGDQLIDNFWMDEDRWKMMSTDGFFQLVVEEALDDLKKAPVDVQQAVKNKFDRLKDKHGREELWPLGE